MQNIAKPSRSRPTEVEQTIIVIKPPNVRPDNVLCSRAEVTPINIEVSGLI